MNIEDLLDQIDEIVDKSMSLPGGKRLVNAEALREVVDDIRLNVPQEIKQARGIVADRGDIITTAKREADAIVRAAEERAKVLVSQEEITRTAQERSAEILAQTQKRSREMRRAAQDFVENFMRRADEGLTANLTEFRRVRSELKQQQQGRAEERDR